MDKQLEELIRDITKAGFMPKSEARRRICELMELARNEGYTDGCSNPNYHDGVHDEQERIVEILEGVESFTDKEIKESGEWEAGYAIGYNAALTQAIAKIKEMK